MKYYVLIALIALFVPNVAQAGEAKAIFAAGCFWCIEKDMEHVEGVTEAVSGYIGGHIKNPTYKQVSGGGTGHYEAVEVTYDPDIVSYKQLLKVLWNNVDPHDAGGQYCDKGDQYRAAIFYGNEAERQAALASKRALEDSRALKSPIVTGIVAAAHFYPAEEYHQDYYKKSSWKYSFYRNRCGRDMRIEAVWSGVNLDEILK